MTGALHVCYGPPGNYIGQVRGVGCRKWRTVTRRCGTAEAALSRAVCRMRHDDKRARALWVALAHVEDWYGPHVAMEASR